MSRRDEVLAALRRSGADGGVSGEALASRLGVSRAAVAKHVSALKALGYGIEARAGEGYRLVSVPDTPIPEEVAPLLASSMWTRLEGGGETGSTNADAAKLARENAPEGTVVLAVTQTAGRGRLGRDWASPEGGTYLSAVLRPDVPPSEVASLALALGVGAARGLEGLGASVGLKWPNDVMVGERKLAGILLEMSAEADCVSWVVAGMGVNVCAPRQPGTAHPRAAYLSETLPDVRRAAVAAAVLDGFAEAYVAWRRDGFEALRSEYERRSTVIGRQVTVSDRTGRELAAGTAAGVDGTGRLLVETAGGTRAFSAGDVTLRTPAA